VTLLDLLGMATEGASVGDPAAQLAHSHEVTIESKGCDGVGATQ
jgi:hypothetical protein